MCYILGRIFLCPVVHPEIPDVHKNKPRHTRKRDVNVMKLLFLGTGAADWLPDAKTQTGEFRRHSSALVDGTILIDPGAGVCDAIQEYHVDVSKIRYILVTHRHPDHFNEKTVDFLQQNGAELIELSPGEQVQLGKYTVLAVEGHHPVKTLHYFISDGNSRLFYALDGAWLLYDEIEAMKQNPVDFAVLDGTIGFIKGDYRIFEHNSMDMIIHMKATLSRYIKQFCISHMSRGLHRSHTELVEALKPHDIIAAYDGWEAEF